METECSVLYIDTSDSRSTRVALVISGKKFEKISSSKKLKSQMVLPMIEFLLKSAKKKITDISEIQIEQGPGSFTGLRVGIAVANTLAWLLKIPVNGREDTIVTPSYRRDF